MGAEAGSREGSSGRHRGKQPAGDRTRMSESSDPDSAAVALDVWLDFLQGSGAVDDLAFERLCGERPDLAPDLRELKGRWEAEPVPRGAAPETPFDERLRRLGQSFAGGTRYEREGVIARGGMGVVHRVKDLQLGRTLALKEMSVGAATQHTLAAARFFEEAQITSQLDHPGIVPVHECGMDADGRLFFAMKLVQGDDLRTLLAREEPGKWSLPRLLDVLLKVCEAMAYAHSKGVIHRDLKPANIMVGHFGEVYVMDWGLARAIGRRDVHDLRLKPRPGSEDLRTMRREEREETPDSPLVTMDGVVLGTPAYMSPEQARGEIERLSSRSDVYSLGAVLYHLLAGVAPYAAPGTRSTRAIVERLIAGPPPALREVAPGAPPELVASCLRAMARDPAQRYPDMTAMRDDLRAYLEGRVVRAHESGALAELRKWIGRNKTLSATAAAGLVALVGGFATSSTLYVRAADEKERANAKSDEALRRSEEVLRLSDLQELDDLTAEADALWPIGPESAKALEPWLDRAGRLIAALPEHEAKLAALKTSAADVDHWWRNQLTKLVAGLKALEDPVKGLISGISPEHGLGIERRLDFANSVRERSLESDEAAERWRAACASIRDRAQCPLYSGLELAPQLGLLPLDRDPDSGLWEFAHLLTGEPAERGPDGKLAISGDTGLVFVLIPGGSFWMGAQATDPAARNYMPWAAAYESPVHEVSLDPFFLSKYEMTQAQWARLTGQNPSDDRDGNAAILPVEQVSWFSCDELMRRLQLTLPTEAQWEYAARAGTETIWWTGGEKESLEGAANLADVANQRMMQASLGGGDVEAWLDDGHARSSPVGSYRANPFGLHDVVGNVSEWCRDSMCSYNDEHRKGDGQLKYE